MGQLIYPPPQTYLRTQSAEVSWSPEVEIHHVS